MSRSPPEGRCPHLDPGRMIGSAVTVPVSGVFRGPHGQRAPPRLFLAVTKPDASCRDGASQDHSQVSAVSRISPPLGDGEGPTNQRPLQRPGCRRGPGAQLPATERLLVRGHYDGGRNRYCLVSVIRESPCFSVCNSQGYTAVQNPLADPRSPTLDSLLGNVFSWEVIKTPDTARSKD